MSRSTRTSTHAKPAGIRFRERGTVSRRVGRAAVLLALPVIGACATLQQLTALRHVDFALDRLTRVELAGVDLYQIRGFEDLSLTQGMALAEAVRRRDLALDLGFDVRASNPESNLEARMVSLDWTLFLEDRETVSGRIDDEIVLPPGRDTPVPVSARLDLVDFFEGGARELFDVAWALTGNASEPANVTLSLLPTIRTALGPITYEAPIRVTLPAAGR